MESTALRPRRARAPVAAPVALAALAAITICAPPARAELPLRGATLDYEYDGADVHMPERAWSGRVFAHERVASEPDRPTPLVVFLHGLNEARVKYRWMGGSYEDDLRRVVAELIEAGRIAPVLVAAPSSVTASAATADSAWAAFDLEHFVGRTAAELGSTATVDVARVVVVGHSGAGCNLHGGLAGTLSARVPPLAVLAVDTCMGASLAEALVGASPATRVYVTWQELGWRSRAFDAFVTVFQRTLVATPPPEGAVRVLDRIEPTRPHPHDAVVRETLEKYLPVLFPPMRVDAAPGPDAPASSLVPEG